MGSSGSNHSKRMSLRVKIVLLMGVSLAVLFGITGGLVVYRVNSISRHENEQMAKVVAESIADAMQAFGETGEMDGLAGFIKNVQARGELAAVRAVRAPATVKDFEVREGAEPEGELEALVLKSGKPEEVVDNAAHQIQYVLPLPAVKSCLECHASAKEGDVLGLASVTVSTAEADSSLTTLTWNIAGLILLAILLEIILIGIVLNRSVFRPITLAIEMLTAGAEQVAAASHQISAASQSLAEGATEQAASLEESAAALEQLSAQSRGNADQSGQASAMMEEAGNLVTQGRAAMQETVETMNEIQRSSKQVAGIVKTIEEIAFQTNLLALNAAVEAARAGEHGRGFAVVADEVRNLAQRAAQASRETGALIERNVEQSNKGATVVECASEVLDQIAESAEKAGTIVAEITTASNDQAEGVGQVNNAVAQMDRVTQSNAANAEEAASASEELAAQSGQLRAVVGDLAGIIGGAAAHNGVAHVEAPSVAHRAPAVALAAPVAARRPKAAAAVLASPEQVIPLDENDEDFADF